MSKRRLIIKGFCKELNNSDLTKSASGEMKKEANPLFNTLKSLKGLKSLKSTNTFKALSKIWSGGKSKGLKGLIDEAAKYKTPYVNVGKNLPKKINLPEEQMMDASLGRGLRHAIGNTADNIKSYTKGLGSAKGFGKVKQLGKNIKDTLTKQLRGSQIDEKEFTSLNKAKDIFKNNKGEKILRSKAPKPIKNLGLFKDRKILSETGRGVLVKKRLPARIAAPLATSPGAVGATGSSFLAQSALEPKKPTTDKITQSLQEGGRFLAGDAIGFASYLL